MRINARALFRSALLLFLASGVFISAAAAGSITVDFTGSVTGELPGASYPGNLAAGDAIVSSSFTYAIPTISTGTGSSATYVLTSLPGNSMSLNVSTPGFNPSGWADFYLGSPNVYQVTVSKSGSTTTLDLHVATLGGTAEAGSKVNASIDVILTSTTYTGGVNLPTTTAQFLTFATTKATLNWDPLGPQGVEGFYSNNIQVNSINGQSVPEPSSLVLGVGAIATGAAGFFVSRRKAAQARHRG